MRFEGAKAYVVRKRLKESRSLFAARFQLHVSLYDCYERNLIDIETIDIATIKKIRGFVKTMIDAKPLTNREKVTIFKKVRGFNDNDICKMLGVSLQTLARYKTEPDLLSEYLLLKINEILEV